MTIPGPATVGAYVSPQTGLNAAVAVPSGVAANDIIIVSLHKENSNTVTMPSGFALLDVVPLASPGFWHYVFWKRATGADTGTYTFSWSGDDWRTAIAIRIPGCITSGSPFDVTTHAESATLSATTPAVSLTTTGPDRLLLWLVDLWDTADVTAPASYTRPTNTWPTNRLLDAATRGQAAAGATGSVTGTLATSRERIARLLALLPAATTAAPTVDAGADASITLGGSFSRTATENNNGSTITSRAWTIQAGPAGVGTTISTAAALSSWTPTTSGSYTLRYSATNALGTGTDDVAVTVNPPAPGSVFDLTDWKITLPTGPSSDATEVTQPTLNTYSDSNFQLNASNQLVMTAPVQGSTTSGSGGSRCEFREMESGAEADYTLAGSGFRQLTVSAMWDPTNITDRKEMIVGQIHGVTGTPPIYLAAEFHVTPARLRIYKDGPGLANVVTDLTPTTLVTYRIRVYQGRVKLWAALGPVANLPATPAFDWAASEFADNTGCYFKAGAYNKSTVATGGTGSAITTITYMQLIQPGDPIPSDSPEPGRFLLAY